MAGIGHRHRLLVLVASPGASLQRRVGALKMRQDATRVNRVDADRCVVAGAAFAILCSRFTMMIRSSSRSCGERAHVREALRHHASRPLNNSAANLSFVATSDGLRIEHPLIHSHRFLSGARVVDVDLRQDRHIRRALDHLGFELLRPTFEVPLPNLHAFLS
jgi:hypothetical protein